MDFSWVSVVVKVDAMKTPGGGDCEKRSFSVRSLTPKICTSSNKICKGVYHLLFLSLKWENTALKIFCVLELKRGAILLAKRYVICINYQ